MASYRFGKLPVKHDYRTLRFSKYVTDKLPPPPPAYDVLARVYQNLKVSDPTVLFPMDGNNTIGDCTIAALAHASTVYHGLIGERNIMPEVAVKKLYWSLTHGTDSGLVELDVLNYWRTHKIAGDNVVAYAAVNPKNHVHVQQAAQLFGGLYIGFQCQKNVIEDFEKHIPWTSGELTNSGHAVYMTSYSESDVTVLTWGNVQKGDWGWWDLCVDEAYVLLSTTAKTPGFSPGFDFARLQADLSLVAD